MLESTTKFVLLTDRRNQHDKAWKVHAWVRLLIFNDAHSKLVLLVTAEIGIRGLFCAFRHM